MAKKQASDRTKSGQFRKGVSGNANGRTPKFDAEAKADAVFNALTGMGNPAYDKTSANSFCVDVVDAETGMQLWRGDPIGARIVETPPNEAIRQGYDICIGDDAIIPTFTPDKPVAPPQAPPQQTGSRIPKTDWTMHPSAFERRYMPHYDKRSRMDASTAQPLAEKITKHFQDLKVNKLLKEAWCYARASGGGALLIGANDYTTDLRQPLDLTKVRSLDYLTPLEGRELVPMYWYNNPRAPKFGEPAIFQMVPYTIGAAVDGYGDRVMQVHESRLLRFHGPRVTRRLQNGGTYNWGDSVFTRCGRALMAWNSSVQGASQLMADFAQAVYKIQGLAELISKNPGALQSKMLQVNLMRSIARAMLLDATEDFERKATPMTGYPETMDRLAANVASAADQPLSLLFGQAPAGLNATGDSDIRFFYDRVASGQHEHLAPEVCKLIEIELAIAGENPDTTNYSLRFKPLWQATELETAQARFQQAQTDQIYIINSVVSPEEIAVSRFGGDQYSYDTHVDFDARMAQDAAAAPVVDADPKPDPAFSTNTTPPEAYNGVDPAKGTKPTGGV